MLKRAAPLVALALLAAVLLGGIGRLCLLRFRAGDIYPPCSSLRGDPLGVKAFHDALAGMDGLTVLRNYRPLDRLKTPHPGEPFTLFQIGGRLDGSVDSEDWEALVRFAAQGNRVVLAFAPVTSKPKSSCTAKAVPSPSAKPSPSASPVPKRHRARVRKSSSGELGHHHETLCQNEALRKLGIGLEFEPTWARTVLTARADLPGVEPSLSWHSIARFEPKDPLCRVLYRCAKKPVALERRVGRGTMVISADSFFVTNEALRGARAPKLLAWLAGGSRTIVFDEALHGITENAGVATLLRDYRLGGVIGVLALLAVLFVWKDSSPLLPRHPEPSGGGGEITVRGTAQGFVNLLRRAVPPSRLIGACIDEWNKSFARQAGTLAPPADGTPVEQYRLLSETLSKTPQ